MIDEKSCRALLLQHCKDVFATMLNTDIEERPAAPEGAPRTCVERVVSLIGFGGDYTGNCVINCSKSLACKIASTMLMEEYQEVNASVMDALGEISNMVFGNVKTELEDILGPLQLSMPTVIEGSDFNMRSLANPSWIVIPFMAGGEELEARMCISARTRPQQARAK